VVKSCIRGFQLSGKRKNPETVWRMRSAGTFPVSV